MPSNLDPALLASLETSTGFLRTQQPIDPDNPFDGVDGLTQHEVDQLNSLWRQRDTSFGNYQFLSFNRNKRNLPPDHPANQRHKLAKQLKRQRAWARELQEKGKLTPDKLTQLQANYEQLAAQYIQAFKANYKCDDTYTPNARQRILLEHLENPDILAILDTYPPTKSKPDPPQQLIDTTLPDIEPPPPSFFDT